MPRGKRIHLLHGTYYASHRSLRGQRIFERDADYALFERLLASVLARCEAQVNAYYWQPSELHLVVRISQVPLSSIMQRAAGHYSRAANRLRGVSGSGFQPHYRALLLDAEAYLPRIIRYLHYLPVLQGAAREPRECATTSHRAYLGCSRVPWLSMPAALRPIRRRTRKPSQAYLDLMSSPPSQEDVAAFTTGSPQDRRVMGNAEFMASLPRSARIRRTTETFEGIVAAVVHVLDIERAEIFSRSSTRRASLARAMITWHAVERGVASLTQVARLLYRHPSTLSLAVTRYRLLNPPLFEHDALRCSRPILPIPAER